MRENSSNGVGCNDTLLQCVGPRYLQDVRTGSCTQTNPTNPTQLGKVD